MTGTPGSEARAGETDRPRGRHRAPARPYFHALCEAEQLEVLLVNAQHVKNVPGRKTDAKDAKWLAELGEVGLLRGSFIPPAEIAAVRELTRYRKKLTQARTSELQRLCKVLEDGGVKIDSVASSITTMSARAMVEALIAGERDPRVLAELALGRMRKKIPILRWRLRGGSAPITRYWHGCTWSTSTS